MRASKKFKNAKKKSQIRVSSKSLKDTGGKSYTPY